MYFEQVQILVSIGPLPTLCDPPTQSQLMRHVAPIIIDKWRQLGEQLCISSDQLDAIASDCQSKPGTSCVSIVFSTWERCQTRLPYSWSTLIDALRSRTVEEYDLASQIEGAIQPK